MVEPTMTSTWEEMVKMNEFANDWRKAGLSKNAAKIRQPHKLVADTAHTDVAEGVQESQNQRHADDGHDIKKRRPEHRQPPAS